MKQLDPELVAQAIKYTARAVRWLRWPSLLLAVLVAGSAVTLLALSLSWQGWPRIAGAVVAVCVAVVVVFFLRQRAGTLKAAANPEALRAEITGFVASGMDKVELVEKLSALAQGGGLRFIPRLQAAWSISQLPSDVIAHLDEQEHLRWFVPPQISATWMWTVTTFWTGFGCVCLISVLGALSATSVL